MIKKNKQSGFTLLEILIVLVIIGIATSFAFLALGDFGASRQAEVEANRLLATLKIIRERAILEVNTFGLGLHQGGYEIYRFEKHHWTPLSSPSVLRPHRFAEKIKVSFAINPKNGAIPQIVINPEGSMSPIALFVGTEANNKLMVLTIRQNGELMLEQVKHEA